MDIFGVGGSELILLLLLGGVLLGPRRLVGLARDAGKLVAQVRSITSELTRQVNSEIAQLDLMEARKRTPAARAQPPPAEPAPLPEAYQRFRDDFPGEGQLEAPSPSAPAASPEAPGPTPAAQ